MFTIGQVAEVVGLFQSFFSNPMVLVAGMAMLGGVALSVAAMMRGR